MKLLLDYGADTRRKVEQGGNLTGETALTRAITYGQTPIVKLLLDHGADPNILYNQSLLWTPLITASGFGQVDIVKLLLRHGADASIHDRRGDTALSIAELAWRRDKRKGCDEVIRLLRQAGAKR